MRDYLREYCINLNIELIYTEGDLTALAVGIKSNSPFIKVSKIFEGCPEEVAKAVIDYYTDSQYEHSCLKLLRNYIGENVVTVEYTIQPPDERFKSLFVKHMETNNPPQSTASEQSTSKEKITGKSESKGNVTKKSAAKGNTTKKSAAKDKTQKRKVSKEDTSSFVEMEIASITKSSFWGKPLKIDPDEAIRPSTDDVISLEIEIDDSKL